MPNTENEILTQYLEYWLTILLYRMLSITCPTKRASVAQGLLRRVRRKDVAWINTPSIPKNALGPVGISLKRGALGAN